MTNFAVPAHPGFVQDGNPVVAWIVSDDGSAAQPVVADRALVATVAHASPVVRATTPAGTKPHANNPESPARLPSGFAPFPWTGKTYKLQTSWHYIGEEGEFIFHVPGETPTPKSSLCQKINRDQFAELKKTLRELPYEVVHGDVALVPVIDAAQEVPPEAVQPDAGAAPEPDYGDVI